ncbi:MAG TPA: hypothetical protein VFW19_10820 [Allosphingosinicella sp.]|nr:hypothetical protein [Allosphingosinicella sp.]
MSANITIVFRQTGDYEITQIPIRAFIDNADAEAFSSLAAQEWDAAFKAVPDNLECPGIDASDHEWSKWARRRTRAWGKFRRMLTCDPKAAPVSEWFSPEEPTYHLSTVPLTSPMDSPHA